MERFLCAQFHEDLPKNSRSERQTCSSWRDGFSPHRSLLVLCFQAEKSSATPAGKYSVWCSSHRLLQPPSPFQLREPLTRTTSKEGGERDNGAEKKSSTAINWLSYSPMVTRSHCQHKTQRVFPLGLVLLCPGPSGLLPRHMRACVGVQV